MTLTVPPVPAYWGPLFDRQWVLSRTGRRFTGWLATQDDPQAQQVRAAVRAHDSAKADAADMFGWLDRWAAATRA